MSGGGAHPNPYQPPGAVVRDDVAPPRRSVGLLLVAIIEAIIGTAAAIMVPLLIGHFEELFKGFGADLPAPTRLVISTKYVWWLFGLAGIGVLAWIVKRPSTTHAEQRRQLVSVVGYTLTFCAAWGLLVYFLYLPIFRLGSAV